MQLKDQIRLTIGEAIVTARREKARRAGKLNILTGEEVEPLSKV
jgi:hypothetical protein